MADSTPGWVGASASAALTAFAIAFTTRDAGLVWAVEHHVTGILTEYPIGGAYDVAVAEGRFAPTRPHHGTPDQVASFSPGFEHVHLADGQPHA